MARLHCLAKVVIVDFNQCFGPVRTPSAGQKFFSVFFLHIFARFDAKMRQNEHSFALFPEGYISVNYQSSIVIFEILFTL